jgi:hypothetical protein
MARSLRIGTQGCSCPHRSHLQSPLRKHKHAVAQFYRTLSRSLYKTEVAIGYNRLFTFLDHDGVQWNDNNAEHAIKAFARLRKMIGANGTPKGIPEYLAAEH